MDTVELLAKFADPEVIKTLSMMDRLTAGLITTILGMGITFVALVVLQFIIGMMAKLSSDKPAEVIVAHTEERQPAKNTHVQDEEIVAAITAAIATQLKTSVNKIVIRNIERVEGSSSAWQKAGIAEHMNNSL